MTTALLVIDLQQEFARRTAAGLPRSNPGAEARITELLGLFRARGLPVVHVHHDDPDPAAPFRLDGPGGQPMPCAAPLPGEPVHVKHGSSGFVGTGLEAGLRAAGITRLVVIGAAVNYCVDSTIRGAANLGFDVLLPADATFGFGVTGPTGRQHDPDEVLSVILGSLAGDFAEITTAAAIPARL